VGIGAEFRLAYELDETVSVALWSGQLSVRDRSGAEREFSGSSALRLSQSGISKLPDEPVARQAETQDLAQHWAQASLTPVFLSSEPEGAILTIDGVESGRTPLSMMLSRGAHRVEFALSEFEPELRTLEVKGAERITETFALRRVELPEEGKVSAPLGPAALLARAQTSRKQGQYLEAARNYQMILSRFPSSSEAAATRLSLGDLQLSQLGAPEAALNSFRQYLTAGGALRQEASYGEIRALRALGRSEEARSLARKFSASYPQSGQAVSLRRWLESPEDSRAK
jgi:tetratricopeptide (TPR) repeat protein